MGTSQLRLLALATGLAFGAAARADGMTYAQYESEEKDLGARFEEAGTRCDAYVANARDVCLAEARGRQSVARAELRAQYQPGAKNLRRVLRARADAIYAVSIERCDEEAGEDKISCVKEAEVIRIHSLAEPRESAALGDGIEEASSRGPASVRH
jgi:hypothetical protein